MKIPILNLYYLLCYAWDRLPDREIAEVAIAPPATLPDLFAKVLSEGVARLLRRGLDRDYVLAQEDVPGVRGKIDVSTTLQRALLSRVETRCEFDEFEHDVLQNRILKASLRNLLRVPELDSEVADDVRGVFRRLHGITDIELQRHHFNQVRIHRNNRAYRFLLDVCQLIHDNLLVTSNAGEYHFRDFRRDEDQMWRLFEDFVRNFLAREQDRFDVSRPEIRWDVSEASEVALSRLPRMRTDVVLREPGRVIILDTKFYRKSVTDHHGSRSLISQNLYQVLSYVTNGEATRPGPEYEGMLLYPVVGEELKLDYRILGHRIRIRTIDLDQPWPRIHEDMLRLVEDSQGRTVSLRNESRDAAKSSVEFGGERLRNAQMS